MTGLRNPYTTQPPTGTITTATQGFDGSQYFNNDVLDIVIETSATSLQTLTPGSATGTAVRSVTTADANTNVTCAITFTNRMLSGSNIRIQVPLQQFQTTGSSFEYIESGGSTANSMTTISTTSDYVTLQFTEFCSGGGSTCSDGTTMTLTITSGFKNSRTVLASITNYFVYQSYTSDQNYQIDQSTDNIEATPAVDQAAISSIAVSFQSSVTAYEGYADVSAVLGSTVTASDFVELSFSAEFILETSTTLACSKVDGSTVTSLTCTNFTITSGYVSFVKVEGLCPCDSTTTYTIRLSNIGTLLEAKAFTGTLTYNTKASDTEGIGTGTLDLSTISTLTPAELTSTSVTRTATSQGANSIFTINFTIPGTLLDSSTIQLGLPLNQIALSGSAFG